MQTIPLEEIPLFAGLSDAAKAEVRSTCALREYSAGDVILEIGEIGQFLYAIDADQGQIVAWSVDEQGHLSMAGSWGGVPTTVAGLAAV